MVLQRPGPREPGPLEPVEARPTRGPGPGELLLEVDACAVCRTDLQLAEGDLPARRLPIVPGHQAVGRVAALGAGRARLARGRPGRRLLAGRRRGTLPPLPRRAREPVRATPSSPAGTATGGFAERMVVRADFAAPPARAAPTTSPSRRCSAAGSSATGRCGSRGIAPGGRAGPLRLRRLGALRHPGGACTWAARSTSATRSERERERARALGAAWAGAYDDRPPRAARRRHHLRPGRATSWSPPWRALDRGGTVAVNAIHLDRIPEFPYDLLWWERDDAQRRQRHPRRRRRVPRARRRDPGDRTPVESHPLEDANAALGASRAASRAQRCCDGARRAPDRAAGAEAARPGPDRPLTARPRPS